VIGDLAADMAVKCVDTVSNLLDIATIYYPTSKSILSKSLRIILETLTASSRELLFIQLNLEKLMIHGAYSLPDNKKGADFQWIVVPKTLQELFDAESKIIIPLFQRTYCWPDHLIYSWFKDVVNSRSKADAHNVGKVIFQRRHDGSLLCIDGQQRLTTSMMFLSAARDVASLILNEEGLAQSIEKQIFNDVDAMQEWNESKQEIAEGNVLQFSRLIPSYRDRAPFHCCIIRNRAVNDSEKEVSLQANAKAIFTDLIQKHIENNVSESCKAADVLARLVEGLLNKIRVMYMEAPEALGTQQLFLWLQEKALFGMGALLFNPTPGIKFCACDLIRNLFLSWYMDLSLEEQEKIYLEVWLKPLELVYRSPVALDTHVQSYLDNYDKCFREDASKRFKCEFETKSEEMIMFLRKNPEEFSSVLLYGRFLSLYEELKISSASQAKDFIEQIIAHGETQPTEANNATMKLGIL
jgi:hypothetical protein